MCEMLLDPICIEGGGGGIAPISEKQNFNMFGVLRYFPEKKKVLFLMIFLLKFGRNRKIL